MAAIPPALKAADIARFAQRAGQVEKAKPVVTYWCNYWIIEQIIAKGLHKIDDESKTYTMNLMDKLEQTKSDFKDNDAITDELAGQAYIEQFGLETFQRADNAMKANKASRQTADTFQAAATFLELCQIWGPLEPETASKIKFAKYHSLRILKAMKAGEDPNLSNPAPEPEEQPPLDPNDPEVQMLNASGDKSQLQNGHRQPSVTEVPDEHDRLEGHLAQRSTYNESLHPSRAPSVPPQSAQNLPIASQTFEDGYYHDAAAPKISPIDPPDTDKPLAGSAGYFPTVPDTIQHASGPSPPNASPSASGLPSSFSAPDSSILVPPGASGSQTSQPAAANSLHSFPPPSMDDSSISASPSGNLTTYPPAPPPSIPTNPIQPPTVPRQVPQTPVQPPLPTPRAPAKQAGPTYTMTPPPTLDQIIYTTDEEAILKAQKHARWAISALNFEDVNTAVKELRGALESLGAN